MAQHYPWHAHSTCHASTRSPAQHHMHAEQVPTRGPAATPHRCPSYTVQTPATAGCPALHPQPSRCCAAQCHPHAPNTSRACCGADPRWPSCPCCWCREAAQPCSPPRPSIAEPGPDPPAAAQQPGDADEWQDDDAWVPPPPPSCNALAQLGRQMHIWVACTLAQRRHNCSEGKPGNSGHSKMTGSCCRELIMKKSTCCV